jgi:hypothetical protein
MVIKKLKNNFYCFLWRKKSFMALPLESLIEHKPYKTICISAYGEHK